MDEYGHAEVNRNQEVLYSKNRCIEYLEDNEYQEVLGIYLEEGVISQEVSDRILERIEDQKIQESVNDQVALDMY